MLKLLWVVVGSLDLTFVAMLMALLLCCSARLHPGKACELTGFKSRSKLVVKMMP